MTDRMTLARDFAIAAHGTQRYGMRPYSHHLAAVVQILEDAQASEEMKIAGWLHDVIEDTDVTEAEISAAFGEKVARLVGAVSGGGSREAHVAAIYEKIKALPAAATVKLADRIANIEAATPGDRHSLRYAREHTGFAEVVEPLAPPALWARYMKALLASA